MAWVNMDVAPTVEGGGKNVAFEKTLSLDAAGSCASILIPDDVQNVMVTAQASGTTTTVYSTTSSIAAVKADSGVTWLAWTAGAIATATGTAYGPVTAIKMIQAGAGSSKLEVRAQ